MKLEQLFVEIMYNFSMDGRYKIRSQEFEGKGWRPRFTNPGGQVINGVVFLADVNYPSDNYFKTKEEADNAAYNFLIAEKVYESNIIIS